MVKFCDVTNSIVSWQSAAFANTLPVQCSRWQLHYMLARLHVVNALHCGANLGVYSRYCCRNDTPRKHWLQQLCQTACRNSSVLANNNIFKPCVDCRDPMMLAVRVPVMHTFCQTACRSRFSQCSGVFAAGCCIPDAHRCSISKVAHVDELTTCRSWI